jgi:kynureninase
VELLVDAYHAVNVVPFSLRREGLTSAYVVGGGYKYCQLGEGNAFLRVPRDCALQPVISGWFAEFATLAAAPAGGKASRAGGAARFAGATYDPVSHYRAAAVFEFFDSVGLDVAHLRSVSQRQLARLTDGFDKLDLDPARIDRNREAPLSEYGGFLVLDTPHAPAICRGLRKRGVWTDHRDRGLRLGPAPYVSDEQLDDALAQLAEVTCELG